MLTDDCKCGSKAFVRCGDKDQYYVCCDSLDCSITSEEFNNAADAVEYWNLTMERDL